MIYDKSYIFVPDDHIFPYSCILVNNTVPACQKLYISLKYELVRNHCMAISWLKRTSNVLRVYVCVCI